MGSLSGPQSSSLAIASLIVRQMQELAACAIQIALLITFSCFIADLSAHLALEGRTRSELPLYKLLRWRSLHPTSFVRANLAPQTLLVGVPHSKCKFAFNYLFIYLSDYGERCLSWLGCSGASYECSVMTTGETMTMTSIASNKARV